MRTMCPSTSTSMSSVRMEHLEAEIFHRLDAIYTGQQTDMKNILRQGGLPVSRYRFAHNSERSTFGSGKGHSLRPTLNPKDGVLFMLRSHVSGRKAIRRERRGCAHCTIPSKVDAMGTVTRLVTHHPKRPCVQLPRRS